MVAIRASLTGRGVFDGTVVPNGVDGHPTIICPFVARSAGLIRSDTSTYTGSLGAEASPPEQPGTETQSLAYTEDDGETWIKSVSSIPLALTPQVPSGLGPERQPGDL